MTNPVLHTDTQQLRQQLVEVRVELRKLIERGHFLSTTELPRITALYDMYFGELEIEKQHLAVRNAELFRRVELLTIKHARGEKITAEIVALVNEVVAKEYDRMRQRLSEAFGNANSRSIPHDAATAEMQQDELVKTYRVLVKKLHPDVAASESNIDGMWHAVQQAYQQRNTEKLKNLLTVLGADEKVDYQAMSMEDLRAELERLNTKLRIEKRRIQRMEQAEPYAFQQDLLNESWRSDHRKSLEHELAHLRQKIFESARLYKELTGSEAELRSTKPVSKEDETNADHFDTNTYFSGR